ncbi:hypothetical protein E4U46_001249 [Claviceps purpurea]|nr:hypothetical protein E4U46_001249 [Claviceps purpurea]
MLFGVAAGEAKSLENPSRRQVISWNPNNRPQERGRALMLRKEIALQSGAGQRGSDVYTVSPNLEKRFGDRMPLRSESISSKRYSSTRGFSVQSIMEMVGEQDIPGRVRHHQVTRR